MKMPVRERWSVRADGAVGVTSGREHVIFVPDDGDLSLGFEWLRAAVDVNPSARWFRLIGCDVTNVAIWPDWLSKHPKANAIVLTEVDAYLPFSRAARLEALAKEVDAWLTTVFGGLWGDIDPARAFRSSLTNRVLLQAFSAWVLLEGLQYHHQNDTIQSPDARWSQLLEPQEPISPQEHLKFALTLGAVVLGNAGASFGRRAWEYFKEIPSRRGLAERASTSENANAWIGVIGSWPYASRHVIECIKGAEWTAQFGVLLQDTLRAGGQDAHEAQRTTDHDVVFPTLQQPALDGRVGAVDQCVSATGLKELAASFVSAARVMGVATFRAALAGPKLGPFALNGDLQALARVLTIDVLRAEEARAATARLIARRSFSGTTIVWPHASAPSVGVPDLMLQKAGATTVELVHGAFADRQGVLTYAFSTPSVRATWTQAEARMLEPHTRGQRCFGGFVPRGPAVSRTARKIPQRVLALTNYGAGVLGPSVAHHSRLGYCQRAFFQALKAAVPALGYQVAVRWRPHPADHNDSFASILAGSPELELSRNVRSLEEDLESADIVVSSWSSALVEALRHPVPIFVHAIPYYEGDGVLSAFDASRVFSTPDELVSGFQQYAKALKRNASTAREPEAELRRRFFGPSGEPQPAAAALELNRKHR